MTSEANAKKIGMRELLGCVGFAIRLVWKADRRRLVEVVSAQLASALGIMAAVLVVKNLLGWRSPPVLTTVPEHAR